MLCINKYDKVKYMQQFVERLFIHNCEILRFQVEINLHPILFGVF